MFISNVKRIRVGGPPIYDLAHDPPLHLVFGLAM